MRTAQFVAVDVGASSGRVMLATVSAGARTTDPATVALDQVHRFPNRAVELPDGLHWDVLGIHGQILTGLGRIARAGASPRSVGVDTWAVDYGLLDDAGGLLGLPFSYRDLRTGAGAGALDAAVAPGELYRRTGIAALAFNTLPQLMTERGSARLAAAATLLTIPDLLTYWLSGDRVAEVTNASTTQLLDVYSRAWDLELVHRTGLPAQILPPLREPGTPGGALRPEVVAATGLTGARVVAVASHDTASAVAAIPARGADFAYVSSGTWSLVGLELDAPVVTEAARTAGFTNEAGLDGTVRFLRNVSGLWLLQESVRTWTAGGATVDLDELLRHAGQVSGPGALIDVDHPDLLAPGDMPARIADQCRRTGQPVPGSPPEVTRVVLDSLALAYRRALATAERLTGRSAAVVHVVGGGARNTLLCQLTADATGRPVLAGPVEATALGNVLVQARTAGLLGASASDGGADGLAMIRAAVLASDAPARYLPAVSSASAWTDADDRLGQAQPSQTRARLARPSCQ